MPDLVLFPPALPHSCISPVQHRACRNTQNLLQGCPSFLQSPHLGWDKLGISAFKRWFMSCEIFASASIFPKMGHFSELQLLEIIPMTPSIHHPRDMALNYGFVSSSGVLAAASNTGYKYLLKVFLNSGILGYFPLCFSLGCL